MPDFFSAIKVLKWIVWGQPRKAINTECQRFLSFHLRVQIAFHEDYLTIIAMMDFRDNAAIRCPLFYVCPVTK
jgi:hypothetical protein